MRTQLFSSLVLIFCLTAFAASGEEPAAGRIDAVQQEFYTQLATKGVKVLDLADAFRQGEGQRAGPVL